MFDSSDRPQFVPIEVDVPTKERNGIKVTVTVKQNDHQRIYQEATRVLMFVEANINVIAQNFDLERAKKEFASNVVYADDDVIIANQRAINGLSNISKYNAIQGNVCYPIDISTIESIVKVKHMFGNGGGSNGFIYFFKFNRGELNVPPSREEISYDKIYVDRVIRKSEAVINRISKKIVADVSKVKTIYDYMAFLTSMHRNNAYTSFSGLFYSSDVHTSSTAFLNSSIEYPNPYDESIVMKRSSILSDINNSNSINDIIRTTHIMYPIGTATLSTGIKEHLTTTGTKADEYKANIPKFSVQLILNSGTLSVSEGFSESEKEHFKTTKYTPRDTQHHERSLSSYRGITFIKYDGLKQLTMMHFNKLSSNSVFGDGVYFVNDLDEKTITRCREITIKLLSASGNEYNANIMKSSKHRVFTTSAVWDDYLTTKSDVFRGIDITVATLNRDYIRQYGYVEFRKAVITEADECQKYIESGEYLIARTYGHEADITVSYKGSDSKITDKEIASGIISAMFTVLRDTTLSAYKGVIFIKKTSYDKLAKKDIDMSDLVDAKLSTFIQEYDFIADWLGADAHKPKVESYRKIAQTLATRGINDTIFTEVVSTIDKLSEKFTVAIKNANIGASNGYRNDIQGIITRGFKDVSTIIPIGSQSKGTISVLLSDIVNKYPLVGVLNPNVISETRVAATIADYIVQHREYLQLKAEDEARKMSTAKVV
jgi:hypothetical protein